MPRPGQDQPARPPNASSGCIVLRWAPANEMILDHPSAVSIPDSEAPMFPLLVDLNDRLVVVVGGGPVGRRKAASCLAAGARVRIVDQRPAPTEVPAGAEWAIADYRPDHLDGATLVFACGPPALNDQVVAAARARGIWCNRADAPATGDFILPATIRRGDLLVAISTGGAAPSLARRLRQHLERTFDEAFGQWVALLAELRPIILAEVPSEEQRRRLFEELSRPRWLRHLRRRGLDRAREAMLARARALANDGQDDV